MVLLNHLNTETTIPLVFEVPLKVFLISLPLLICYLKERGIYLNQQLQAFIVKRWLDNKWKAMYLQLYCLKVVVMYIGYPFSENKDHPFSFRCDHYYLMQNMHRKNTIHKYSNCMAIHFQLSTWIYFSMCINFTVK